MIHSNLLIGLNYLAAMLSRLSMRSQCFMTQLPPKSKNNLKLDYWKTNVVNYNYIFTSPLIPIYFLKIAMLILQDVEGVVVV